ncbi:MAG: hypothetical protein LUC45_06115 [Paraprevotella sp.]|nr:hypothetical protein [Paraprevotella sp.]
MKVIESFQRAKVRDGMCEDGIVTTDDFAAVIDGSTSKGTLRFGKKTSGRMAMELLCEELTSLPAECSVVQAVSQLTSCLRQYYQQHDLYEEAVRYGENRLTASTVIYSRHRREVWMIGDCLCRFNGQTYENPKAVDRILSGIRADILRYLLQKGHSISDLQHSAWGRKWIFPYLKDQCSFQNATDAGPFCYTVLDGFPVDMKRIRLLSVPMDSADLVLASDGYPVLADTWTESERILADLLERDPLCIYKNPSTKGLIDGNISFDDRTYLRISLS